MVQEGLQLLTESRTIFTARRLSQITTSPENMNRGTSTERGRRQLADVALNNAPQE